MKGAHLFVSCQVVMLDILRDWITIHQECTTIPTVIWFEIFIRRHDLTRFLSFITCLSNVLTIIFYPPIKKEFQPGGVGFAMVERWTISNFMIGDKVSKRCFSRWIWFLLISFCWEYMLKWLYDEMKNCYLSFRMRYCHLITKIWLTWIWWFWQIDLWISNSIFTWNDTYVMIDYVVISLVVNGVLEFG